MVGGPIAPRRPNGFEGALFIRRRSRKEVLGEAGVSGVGGRGPRGGGAGGRIATSPVVSFPLLRLLRRKGSRGRGGPRGGGDVLENLMDLFERDSRKDNRLGTLSFSASPSPTFIEWGVGGSAVLGAGSCGGGIERRLDERERRIVLKLLRRE